MTIKFEIKFRLDDILKVVFLIVKIIRALHG